MNENSFGYPKECKACSSTANFTGILKVKPYYQDGTTDQSMMLIGQDPTIYNKSQGVETVLMLNEERGQLKHWLREDVFGIDAFDSLRIYATNLVKCTLDSPPGADRRGNLILRNCFNKCKNHLIKEIVLYKPAYVISFGEPTHKLFTTLLEESTYPEPSMQRDFGAQFKRVSLNGSSFLYSPCLHIKTFKVAEVYGDKVKQFKTELKSIFLRSDLEG
jgi:uracil-DNA glycosylase